MSDRSDRALSEQLDHAIDSMLAGHAHTASADAKFAALSEIAGTLRDLPDARFKARVSRELQPESIESNVSTFAVIHTVTPFICIPEADKLIEFMKHTFDAEESGRHPHGPDGFVASVRIGDSDLIVMGGESLRGMECPAALHVYVKDCDTTYQRALDSGAIPIGSAATGEPADRPYGERAAFVSDSFGNYWFIATRLGPDYVGAGLGYVTPSLLPSKTQVRPLIDFLERAFGADVEGLHHVAGRVAHAFVRIGEAMLEIAEADETGLRPFGFYVHTNDVDAVYRSAIAAGATSVLPPADQSFGERLAIFQDPSGNRWFAAKRIVPG
jgi:PhnB protein